LIAAGARMQVKMLSLGEQLPVEVELRVGIGAGVEAMALVMGKERVCITEDRMGERHP
jgi:hypothetical protein